MSLTLDEIVEHEDRLRREIVERECLLAAFKVLHGYAANGQGPGSVELGPLVSALLPSKTCIQLPDPTSPPPRAPTALPDHPPVPPYIHPELAAFRNAYGSDMQIVSWAIKRITEDFSLHDIAALLKSEGYPLGSPKISVVLTRLKRRGKIEQITRSFGPVPAVFRKPQSSNSPVEGMPAPVSNDAATAVSAEA